jgi:hypothetical protein
VGPRAGLNLKAGNIIIFVYRALHMKNVDVSL